MPVDPSATLEAVWKLESGRVIATLLRMVRDLDIAEELAQDALLSAWDKWRSQGLPEHPAGWLMTAAKNRAIDHLRRQTVYGEIRQSLSHQTPDRTPASQTEEAADAQIDDDVLRLMFTVCHPLLSPDSRVALALRLVNGLSVAEIARAYLVPETTLAQRITRAKRTLKSARVRLELPEGAEREAQLASVLEAIYLIFNEGYTATSGPQWMRPTLCQEALRLARSLAGLVTTDSEVFGLAALMEFQASRLSARMDSAGEAVLLAEQNRALWDPLLIRRGFTYLEQAFGLQQPVGMYCLQAAIAACHARASTWETTDWEEITALYDALLQIHPTPVVALNRAVAVSLSEGPQAGLEIVDDLRNEPQLSTYHLLYSVRGDLLQKLGRHAEASREFLHAAALTRNEQEQSLMQRRATECIEQDSAGRNIN
ncbi:MAG: RNA polymerase sigma factor [Candidatus Thiodiazotropha sp.]